MKFGTLPLILFAILLFTSQATFAHCDSYDGPVIKDAVLALKTNDVNPVLKWITNDQENEITALFHKTYKLRNGDKEVYEIVEKHFFETLVRLHRETEGAPYTGLKPAGSTKQIIQMTDEAIKVGNVGGFLLKLNKHIEKIVREKYDKVLQLSKVKDNSTKQGREYVEAYVNYTHTIEAIHDIIEHGAGHAGH
ncbi:MAG: hypothetical protein COB01_08825 [Lutibacter sp.]|nr:MAG: hypothetical protein COB01_08825 [Lutibacter sp.]